MCVYDKVPFLEVCWLECIQVGFTHVHQIWLINVQGRLQYVLVHSPYTDFTIVLVYRVIWDPEDCQLM